MAYEVEDEIDWSDGTLDEPPATSRGISKDSGYVTLTAHDNDGLDYLFEPQEEDEYKLLVDTALPPAPEHPALTREPCAGIDVHPNRRQPSEQDYAHFALYQANQKAYEATFLKHFVNHALHPSQIEQCLQDGVDICASVQKYIASISANVNGLANKMVRNAHCRTVNLFANAGKDGAPFWDVETFDRALFAGFSPSNASLLVHKMKESWHLNAPEPSMVRYTTKEYPIDHHSSPFEEIDEVEDTLFNHEASVGSLPAGRIVKQPTKKRSRGRGLPGASIRDSIEPARCGNWLASRIPPVTVQEHHKLSSVAAELVETRCDTVVPGERRLIHDLRHLQDHPTTTTSTCVENVLPDPTHVNVSHSFGGLTQLEQLFSQFGTRALNDLHTSTNIAPSQERVDQVPTWPTRLLQDHKRRLTLRSPQVFRRALPGIRAVIAEALDQGYRPVNTDFEERVIDIELREQLDEAAMEGLGKEIAVSPGQEIQGEGRKMPSPSERSGFVEHNGRDAVRKSAVDGLNASQLQLGAAAAQALNAETIVSFLEQEEEPSGRKFPLCVKRKREQPAAIRMLNMPIERSKKRCKTDANIVNVTGLPTLLEAADRPRRQRITTSVSIRSAARTNPGKRQTSRSGAVASISPTPLPHHPSGSMTLEPHQHLPPDAYFASRSLDEKPAWRCGIKHALGHYYNAGDRRNCPGCFTALSDNTSAVPMDFYLPSRTHYRQPNPTTSWRPSKPFGATYNRARRSKHLSHNSIAKDAYWSAISDGSCPDNARTAAIAATLAHLAPKPPPKDPNPAPTPTPEPDPGPHPSGSTTMEHTQDIPLCAYFTKRERHEEPAWRCDVNHALGRYYLAGDKRSCPGCGSNKGGLGKSSVMDFYLPLGVVVRQEAQEVKWKARRPYRMRDGKKNSKAERREKKENTHNQVASRKYWEAVDAGKTAEEALVCAVRETDRWLDEREDEAVRQAEERELARGKRSKATKRSDQDNATTSSTALNAARQWNARSVPFEDSDTHEVEQEETGDEMHDALVAAFEEQSSSDDSSSESDSE